LVGGTCTPGAVATGYQKFTINATVPSFWYITGLVERSNLYYAQIQLYTGAYTSTAPCTNLLALIDSSASDAPHMADLFWLTPGTYDVVITSSDPTRNGMFAVHADSTKFQKNVQDSDPWVYIPYTSTTTCTSYTSYYAPYAAYTFSVATAGNYDILFWAYNATDISPGVIATLYNGTVSYLGTGTQAVPANPCTGQPYVMSDSGDSTYTEIYKSYYDSGALMNVPLNANYNYTVMITSYNGNEYNAYGVWYRPSLVGTLGTVANYNSPSLSSGQPRGISEPCDADTSGHVWNTHVMTSTYSTVVVDTGYSPDSLDESTCIYSGNNTGVKYTTSPINCSVTLLQCGDSGSSAPLAVSGLTNSLFTVIEFPYYSGVSYAGYRYTLWVYSGTQLGPSANPISGTSTGDNGSSSSASTQAVFAVLVAIAALF
jgi:hypothetical protein